MEYSPSPDSSLGPDSVHRTAGFVRAKGRMFEENDSIENSVENPHEIGTQCSPTASPSGPESGYDRGYDIGNDGCFVPRYIPTKSTTDQKQNYSAEKSFKILYLNAAKTDVEGVLIFQTVAELLEVLPPEIRLKIFCEAFENYHGYDNSTWVKNGLTYFSPGLSLAPWCFLDWRWLSFAHVGYLAAEVLEALYKGNTFSHTASRIERFLNVPESYTIGLDPRRYIKHLIIYLDQDFSRNLSTALKQLHQIHTITFILEDKLCLHNYYVPAKKLLVVRDVKRELLARGVRVSVYCPPLVKVGVWKSEDGLFSIDAAVEDEEPEHTCLVGRPCVWLLWSHVQGLVMQDALDYKRRAEAKVHLANELEWKGKLLLVADNFIKQGAWLATIEKKLESKQTLGLKRMPDIADGLTKQEALLAKTNAPAQDATGSKRRMLMPGIWTPHTR